MTATIHVPLITLLQSVALKEEQPPGLSQSHSPSLNQLHLPWEATRMGEGPLLCASLVDRDLTGRQCEKGVDCISLVTHTYGRRGVSLVTACSTGHGWRRNATATLIRVYKQFALAAAILPWGG